MVNSKALEHSIRPQPRCLVNYQILSMLCKPLRIVLTPLEYEKQGIFKIDKGPGWHLKSVKLNLKKYKKINNVSKITKAKKIRKKELPKTTEINVPKPSQEAEVINCVEDSNEDKDFILETIQSVIDDPIFECIESVVQENSDATKPLKNITSSRIKHVKKKSGVPVVNKDQIKTPEVAVVNKDQSETPLVADVSKDQSKSPVVADANKDQSKTPVVAVESKDQSKTPVVVVSNKYQSKTPVVAVASKYQSKTPVVAVVNKDQSETPLVAVVNKEQCKTPLIPVVNEAESKAPTVIVTKKNKTEKPSDKSETIPTNNETSILDLPVFRNVLQQHDGVISSSDDDDDDFTDTYVPTYDDISTDEDSNISTEVDDPLPPKEVKTTSKSEKDVLTVPPNTDPEPNPTPNIVNEPKRYKCNQCELSFIHEQQKLRNHELTHYPEDMVQPADCNIEKESSDEFEKEFIEPPKKKKYKRKGWKEVIRITCQFCPAVFTNKKTLNIHEAAHINKQEFKFFCDKPECNAKFVGKRDFEYHQNTFHTIKKYVCNVCNVSYRTKAVLKTHMFVHSDKKFKCKKCGQTFRHQSSLGRHMKLHKRPKNYPCNICSKSFSTAFELKQHLIRLHPVEPSKKRKHISKFKCETCGDLFTTYDSLKHHRNIHSGDRPYLCVKCPLTFMSPSTLRYHELSGKHNETKHRVPQSDYPCNECGKSFNWKRSFQRHVEKVHSGTEIKNCEVCGKVGTRSYMNRHMRKHAPKKATVKREFPCNQCPYIGKYKCYLKKHIQIKHTDEKPFKCKLCPAEFRCYVILKRHKETHHDNESNTKVQINKDLKIKDKNKLVETSNEEVVDDPNSKNMNVDT